MKIHCQRISIILATIGVLFHPDTVVRAATTNLVSVADSSLFEQNPTNNLGGLEFLPVGVTGGGKRARGLVRFDVAGAIPAGATITSAALAFEVQIPHGAGQTLALHRMLVPWNEGTNFGVVSTLGSVGAPAIPGDVTWNARVHPGVTWGQPGGQAGVDFAAGASAMAEMSFSSLAFTSAGLVADAQLWLDSAGTNFGWLLIMTGESGAGTASRLGSREASVKPTLSLEYTSPTSSSPPTIFGLAQSAAAIRFSFNGQAGRAYTVESQAALNSGWSTATNIPTLAADSTVHFTNSISGSEKYYRVRTP